MIVVRASGPIASAYPEGRVLPDNVRIRLGAHESVTILGARGSRVFRGPGTFSPADPVRPGERGTRRPQPNRIAGVTMSQIERGRSSAPSVLVVRASGPSARSFPPGRPLPAGAWLELRAGDVLVTLDLRGMLVYRGPGGFLIGRSASPAFGGGVMASQSRSGRIIGAVRPIALRRERPGLWALDIAAGGAFCLAGSGGPILWRASADAGAALTIRRGGDPARTVAWPAGASTLAWPADLGADEEVDYALELGGVPAPAARIRFRRLASAPGDVEGVAAALIENGCQDQLDRLLDAIDAEAPPPSPPPVLIDPDQEGPICLAPGAPLLVSRREEDEALIVAAEDGSERRIDWQAGETARLWPSDLPTAEGARYRLRSPGAGAARAIVFRHLPAPGGDAGAVAEAAALIERGCRSQLDRLVETGFDEGAAPD